MNLNIIFNIFLEDVYFSIVLGLLLTVVEVGLQFLNTLQRSVEKQTFAKIFEIQHGILIDSNIDELLYALPITRHENVAHEVKEGKDFVLVDDEEGERRLDDLQLLLYDIAETDLERGTQVELAIDGQLN